MDEETRDNSRVEGWKFLQRCPHGAQRLLLVGNVRAANELIVKVKGEQRFGQLAEVVLQCETEHMHSVFR